MSINIAHSHSAIAHYARLAEQPLAAAERIQGSPFVELDLGARRTAPRPEPAGSPGGGDRVTLSGEAEKIRMFLMRRSADEAPSRIDAASAAAAVFSMKRGADGDTFEVDDQPQEPPAAPGAEEAAAEPAGIIETLAAFASQLIGAVRDEISKLLGPPDAPDLRQEPPPVRPNLAQGFGADPHIDIRV